MNSEEITSQKDLKQQKNQEIKYPSKLDRDSSYDEQTFDEDSDNECESFQKIRELFIKTEEMKEKAKEKNKEVETQFEHLRERLNSSSAFLNQMKSSIENLRFSYQRKMTEQQDGDFEDYLNNKEKFKIKGDITSYLDELKGKIETLQTKSKVTEVEEDEPQDYQSALEKVVNTLKIIDDGSYSSTKRLGD